MTKREAKQRKRVLVYAHNFIGAPYKWGGNGPYFDCSGFICAMYRPFGYINYQDYGSGSLYQMFPHVDTPNAGDLVFYGPDGGVEHVEIVVNKDLTLGATGGRSDTQTPTLASGRSFGAMVQYRRRGARTDVIGYNSPFAAEGGSHDSMGDRITRRT